jgi:Fibrillar collagen C-terminal domain
LSSKASQNITYHCSNSVAFYSAKKDHHKKAIGLMSWNDLDIRHRGKFSYEVPVDECQVPVFTTLHSLRNSSGTNTLAYLVEAVGQAGWWAGRQIDSQPGQMERWTDEKSDRRKDGQTDRHTYIRQMGRQTYPHKTDG